MPRTKARSCTGKMRHDTPEQAYAHINRMVEKKGAKRNTLFVYPTPPKACKWCHGWHVGHTNVRNRT